MTAVQLAPLDAPTVTPLPGTLLDAAQVVDGLPIGLISGVSQLYESWNCLPPALVPPALCTTGAAKTFGKIGWARSAYVSAYRGATCKGPGFSYTEAPGKLRDAFLTGESATVEAALMAALVASAPALIDLTPTTGTGVDPVTALGILEGYAGVEYVGAPTIHLPRNMVAPLCQQLDTSGATFRTCAGSKVAAGGGYVKTNAGPAAKSATTMWAFVTGEVVVRRGELSVNEAINTTTNDMMFLAERSYLLSWDCLSAAVLVTAPISKVW